MNLGLDASANSNACEWVGLKMMRDGLLNVPPRIIKTVFNHH